MSFRVYFDFQKYGNPRLRSRVCHCSFCKTKEKSVMNKIFSYVHDSSCHGPENIRKKWKVAHDKLLRSVIWFPGGWKKERF